MRPALLASLILFSACTNSGSPNTTDAGANPDLALGTPMGPLYPYVVNEIALPDSAKDHAYDLNGDGQPDNRLGWLLGDQGTLDFCDLGNCPVFDPVHDGTVIVLLALQTTDPARANDHVAGVTVSRGAPTVSPDFSGKGAFVVDPSAPPGTLVGPLRATQFSSENPATTRSPVTLSIDLWFSPYAPAPLPLRFTVHGAHIQFTTGIDRVSNALGLLSGEIHGSIKAEEWKTTVTDFDARLLTDKVCPGGLDQGAHCSMCSTSSTAQQIRSLFDIGGCGNAVAGDCRIDPCEVAQNNVIKEALAPDVQIYDAAGNYAPNPSNTTPDSVSFGIGFTAVQANF